MTVTIKTPAEQDKMRAAGRLAASVLDMIEPFVQPGATTEELDKRCHDFIVDELQSIPANLNYRGFPKTICTSVNHVVCHGIPGDKKLKSGDIVNIDVTVINDGFHGDSSRMFYVGTPTIQAKRLCDVTYEAMWRGIRAVRAGAHRADAAPHRLVGHVAQALGLDGGCADIEHAAAVAVEAVVDDGHVDVHDVTRLELLVAGDAMADDVVHRR